MTVLDMAAIKRCEVVLEIPFAVADTDYRLRPVTLFPETRLEEDAQSFITWRRSAPDAFFEAFSPTLAQSIAWNRTVYAVDNQQINMIAERGDGKACGFIGLSRINHQSGTCELGRVLKNPDHRERGMMGAVIDALSGWALGPLGMRCIELEVFADNSAALNLYQDRGFSEIARHRRQPEGAGERLKWVRCGPGELADEMHRDVLEMIRTAK
jgi:RimJ/RimL family protein N-acetyltransferase